MEQYINEFLILATALFIALLSPGPDFAMILKQSITYGKRASIFSSIGIGLGISVHVIYTILGIGLIISKSIVLFNIIKYMGAAYLIYLGYKSLKSKGMKLQTEDILKNEKISDLKSFTIGFLCNALNPKATLFFLSMFTVVVSINRQRHHDGAPVQLRHAGEPAPGAGVPEQGAADPDRGRAGGRGGREWSPGRGVQVRGRDRGVRHLPPGCPHGAAPGARVPRGGA